MTPQSDQRQQPSRRPLARRLAAGTAVLAAALVIPTLPVAGAAAAGSRSGSGDGRPAAAAGGGTLLAWGLNVDSQLGDGTENNAGTPVQATLPPFTRITSVRAGCSHTVALTSDGKVLAWGFNDDGELGDGNTDSSTTPVEVQLPPGARVTAIRAGCLFSLALTSSGTVLAWGSGLNGELGNGFTLSNSVAVTVKLPPGTRVKTISAGDQHGLALTTSGQVFAWGDNDNGQLGNGSSGGSSPTPVRVRLPRGTKVTSLAAGLAHSLALTSTGKVLAWGLGIQGELGHGHASHSIPVRTRLPKGTRVRSLFAGCEHTVALTTTGNVLTWGLNAEGQLGDGTKTSRDLPVRARLPKGTTVRSISAGCEHTLVRTAAGHVLAWGSGIVGQLGDGKFASSRTPVMVKLAGLAAIAIGSGPVADFSLAIVR